MTERFVAFVRNVMIGREGLHAEVLLDLFVEAGAREPRSYISTGNVTFSARPPVVDVIVRNLEHGIDGVIGRREEVFVRSIPHLQDMVAASFFTRSPYPDSVEQSVSFTRERIDATALSLPIESRRGDVALFAVDAREVYGASRMVDGRTSAPGGLVEKTLGVRVTTRSWNTIRRIAADPESVSPS